MANYYYLNNTTGCQPSSQGLHHAETSFNVGFHLGWFAANMSLCEPTTVILCQQSQSYLITWMMPIIRTTTRPLLL